MRQQRTHSWLLVVCAAIVAVSPALPAQSAAAVEASALTSGAEGWVEVIARLERAALNGSKQVLTDIRTHLMHDLTRASATTGQMPIQYAIAYAEWRLAALPALPAGERDELLT